MGRPIFANDYPAPILRPYSPQARAGPDFSSATFGLVTTVANR